MDFYFLSRIGLFIPINRYGLIYIFIMFLGTQSDYNNPAKHSVKSSAASDE